MWYYYDNAIQKYSETIDALSANEAASSPLVKKYLGTAVAMRAMHYLDAARMYEYLPTDVTSSINESGNDVLGLTYPIGYSGELAKDSSRVFRRATKEEMVGYIEEELNRAGELLKGVSTQNKEFANEDVVNGLKARLYMWAEDYAKARECAEQVVLKYSVLTESEWMDPVRGFNDSSIGSWIWAMRYKSDNWSVGTAIINWASWCSNEALFGYAAAGVYPMIGASVYNQMLDTDFRKKSFIAPASSALKGKQTLINEGYRSELPAYASLKFRPGQGVMDDYSIGAVMDVPLMRVEEMYFISMEATARMGQYAEAATRLSSFMQNYRDPYYFFASTHTADEVVDEIFKQKRIEFWGEGLNFFDYKRLNKPVTRNYPGTNVAEIYQINTAARPAWMNMVFYEKAFGGQINAWNNPDPSDRYEQKGEN